MNSKANSPRWVFCRVLISSLVTQLYMSLFTNNMSCPVSIECKFQVLNTRQVEPFSTECNLVSLWFWHTSFWNWQEHNKIRELEKIMLHRKSFLSHNMEYKSHLSLNIEYVVLMLPLQHVCHNLVSWSDIIAKFLRKALKISTKFENLPWCLFFMCFNRSWELLEFSRSK